MTFQESSKLVLIWSWYQYQEKYKDNIWDLLLGFSYYHPCIYNNLLILTTASPHCHTASTNSFHHLFQSSLQQEETAKHNYTGSTMLNIFADHMLLNIFSLSTFYPFFAYPVLNFSQPHYPTRPYSFFSFLSASLHMLFSFSQNNCLRNEISTYLIKIPWQYEFSALQIIILAPSTPFVTHRLATSLFPVSHNPSSSNDIGFHFMVLTSCKM